MAQSGRSALEGLKNHYDATEVVCPACGYEEQSGGWVGEIDGANARYSRECPSCGALEERTVTFSN